LGAGRVRARDYFIESFAPGEAALSAIADPAEWARLQSAAASTIGDLHRRTADAVRVDARMFDRWVDRPLDVLARIRVATETVAQNRRAIGRMRERLHVALQGESLQVCWIHGDYWLGNLMVGPDRVTPIGVIDWDRAAPGELPLHDLFHLLLYTRRYQAKTGLAEIVALLRGKHQWNRDEERMLTRARSMLPDAGIDDAVMVLLYWLRHTAATLTLYPQYAHDRGYVAANVQPILSEFS
jgi:aminoglycoside phosphotransferase (APT) family kinase protein